jgi:serine/threonine protein kinase
MQHEYEGTEAVLYVRDGKAFRRLKRVADTRKLQMKPRELLLSLCHENLVRITHISLDGDMHMECMQLSLQRHVRAGPPSSAAVKLTIARQVASGLRHLHQHGVQHEDLCPNNILLAWRHGELHVKLCDFYNELTGCNRTAAYAAPEVVLFPAADVTPAADVWAFACCILFLEGAEPFAGFEHAPAILLYLGQHRCVAFRELRTVSPFSLLDCAYAPARHLASSMWAGILALAFAPHAARLSSAQLARCLDALQAPPPAPARKLRAARPALARLNLA